MLGFCLLKMERAVLPVLPLVLLVEVGLLGRISCFCRMRRGRKFMGWR